MAAMEVPLAVIADSANVSQEGKLNIFGIFNRIMAIGFPAQHPQMQLVVALEADSIEADQTKNLEVQLRDSDGKKLLTISGKLKIPKGTLGYPIRINQILPLPGLRFEKAGDYVFKILVGGEPKSSVSFSVVQTQIVRRKRANGRAN
jgi:hypothetical protein